MLYSISRLVSRNRVSAATRKFLSLAGSQNVVHLNHLLQIIAARALATYLIPGCVGRGVKLGSDSSFGDGGAAGGVCESGNMESNKIQEMKIVRMRIRPAQDVRRALISSEKPPDPFGAIFDNCPCASNM